MATLQDIIQQIRGVSYKPEDIRAASDADAVALLRANNIKDGKLNFDDVVYIDKGKVKQTQYLKSGDVLICASSGSKELVGKAAYVAHDLPMTFGAFCKVARPKTGCPQYIGHYFESPHYRFRISEAAAGVNINNIRNEDIAVLDIPFPSIDEQMEIASVLDKIGALADFRKQQLAKLDELVKARFVELFGSPILNSKKWNQEPFADCCEIITGNTPPREHKEYYGNTIEWIKSDNINKGNAYLTQAVEYLSDKGMLVGRTVEPGSILMTCIAGSLNSIGNVAIVNRKVAFNQQINAFVPKKFEPWFLYYLLELIRPILHNTTNQALKCILTKGNLLEVNVIVPPLELQKQFATFACQTDKTKQAVSRGLKKLETLKAARMQHYFG